MAADSILAVLHHLLVFVLFGLLFAELVLVRPGLGGETLRRVAGLDRAYGGIAGLVVVAGVARVIWGLKGWDYYLGNPWFWAKMAAFVAVGLLTIPPTRKIIAWRRASLADGTYSVPAAEIAAIRRYVHLQAGLFLLIPTFAALMARF